MRYTHIVRTNQHISDHWCLPFCMHAWSFPCMGILDMGSRAGLIPRTAWRANVAWLHVSHGLGVPQCRKLKLRAPTLIPVVISMGPMAPDMTSRPGSLGGLHPAQRILSYAPRAVSKLSSSEASASQMSYALTGYHTMSPSHR